MLRFLSTAVFILLRLLLNNTILGGIDVKRTKYILSVVLAFALVMGSFYIPSGVVVANAETGSFYPSSVAIMANPDKTYEGYT